mmetsp:Transcript_24555/g.38293  ORF Transcript_24555/g.38293 Transcript_24555/m.38293 type:complete len:277 (-) Transcript_24555:109-939(-)
MPVLLFLRAFVGADPSALGRLNYESMSQQALMEMLIDGITNREEICGSKDAPEDISYWRRLVTDSDNNVKWIIFSFRKLSGSVNLQWLPSTVEKVYLNENTLYGSLDLTCLPNGLVLFNALINEFCGEVDLAQLPDTLIEIALWKNQLNGTLDLEHLPKALENVYLSINRFFGTVCLTKLPPGLKIISMYRNFLSGLIDVRNLPKTLTELWLSSNNFEGETDFSRLPESLKKIIIHMNERLAGTIVQREGVNVDTKGTQVTIIDGNDGQKSTQVKP